MLLLKCHDGQTVAIVITFYICYLHPMNMSNRMGHVSLCDANLVALG